MHLLGLAGMPRRVYTYLPGMGYTAMNLWATVGAGLLGLGVAVFLVNAVRTLRRGAPNEDPWAADSLEWSTSSPPPVYKFEGFSRITSRYPRWSEQVAPVIRLRADRRESLVTSLVLAEPDHTSELPGPSIWPLVTAVLTGALIVACIFTPWGLPAGVLAVGLALAAWFWPKAPYKPLLEAHVADRDPSEVSLIYGHRDPSFWGVALLIAIESSGLLLLVGTYFYLRGNEPSWPPPGVAVAGTRPAWAGLGLLLGSVPLQQLVNKAAGRGDIHGMRRWLGLSTLCAFGFLALRFAEFHRLPFRWDSHAYGSAFWVLLGYHSLHGVTGVLENLVLLALLWRGPVESKHALDVQLSGLYWYFMVAAGVLCFVVLYGEQWS
jgi:cytochrome c oxidase subunit I+III